MKRDSNILDGLKASYLNSIEKVRLYGIKIKNFHALIYSV